MSRLSEPVGPDDHILGNPEARHVLVEYGDYECPFCGAAQFELERLRRTAGERFCLVFRNFPLTRTHPHALQAAEAAEAAGAQGRFWEMHDLLYENQASLELPALVAFARVLMLDVPRFERDLLEHRFIPRIRRDLQVDADGVVLVSIQALHTELQAVRAENDELRTRLAKLEAAIATAANPASPLGS